MVELSPSMLCADFSRLGEVVRELEAACVDRLHFDVMDGHYVPNLSYGPLVWKALRDITDLPFDAHLMVANPDESLDRYLGTGADWLSVHVETAGHLHRLVESIRQSGAGPGVALNPATPLSAVEEVLPDLDYVTIMSVNPGFAGQSYIPAMTDKIRRLRKMIEATGGNVRIVVDGGMSPETAPLAVAAGADVLVCGGSSVFVEGKSLQENVRIMRQSVETGLKRRDRS